MATKRRTAARVLPMTEIRHLAADIRAMLDDADAGLSRDARLRWEGALTVLEVVLWERSSLASAVLL